MNSLYTASVTDGMNIYRNIIIEVSYTQRLMGITREDDSLSPAP